MTHLKYVIKAFVESFSNKYFTNKIKQFIMFRTWISLQYIWKKYSRIWLLTKYRFLTYSATLTRHRLLLSELKIFCDKVETFELLIKIQQNVIWILVKHQISYNHTILRTLQLYNFDLLSKNSYVKYPLVKDILEKDTNTRALTASSFCVPYFLMFLPSEN